MKVFIYSCRQEEVALLAELTQQSKITIDYTAKPLTIDNTQLASGYQCISVIATPIPNAIIDKLYQVGVRFISTRTIGYDHIDIAYANSRGIRVANISYSPNSVAEYAVMLMLMTLRKACYILKRYAVNDYTFSDKQGRELRNMTVGVIGTGHIGSIVIENIAGFKCKILAYSDIKNPAIEHLVEYVDLNTLLSQSDMITFHAPATPSTHHLLNQNNINLLKKGVIIINTARGALIEIKALIKGLQQNIISAVALDVIENEPANYNIDHHDNYHKDQDIATLESYPNVIITPHIAFNTDQAVHDMIANSINSCHSFYLNEKIASEIF